MRQQMSFRTVVITKQSKISYKNRFLVVKQDNEEKYIHLSEIDTVIVDSISVSITAYLLKELSDNKINIIFCDDKHNPFGELSSYYSSHNSSKKIKNQIAWTKSEKNKLWSLIVKNKILNQSLLLKKTLSDKYELLNSYIEEVDIGDKTNREGHAAKVYFNELFGKSFVRNSADSINSALNYGYAVLLSTINKEVVNNGYITQLGIHHKNEFNEFNLTCDLMEPFRIVIDNFVYYNQEREFNTQYKLDIVNIFNGTYSYSGKKYTLKDIIKFYVKNTLDSISDNEKYKEFIFHEG
jgi:CRISPR-associated endonuclease Cas1 subtype II